MAPNVVSLGEILVEVMRRDRDVPHTTPGVYLGPYPSGAPAIFADSAARLGESTGFIGAVGDDDFGEMLLERLGKDGVDTSHIRVAEGYTTGIAFVMYYSSGGRRFVFHLRYSAAGQLSPEDIDEDYISSARMLQVMGSAISINERCMRAVYKAVDIASQHGVEIFFDPNLRPELVGIEKIREISRPVLEKATVVLPSEAEAYTLTGERDPVEAGLRLLEYGADAAIVKLGSRGSVAATREGVYRAPAFSVREVDPTGAGDVFDAAVAVGYLRGWSMDKILEFANAAGAIKVSRFGPMEGPASYDEVMEFIYGSRHGRHGTRKEA